MDDKRPVFLSINPFVFRFPLTALASILHRISGVVLFGAVGYFLYLLDGALESPAALEHARTMLSQPVHQLTIFASLLALVYHLILGIKHLLLDFHIGDSLEGSNLATKVCVGLFAVFAVAIAVWIWG